MAKESSLNDFGSYIAYLIPGATLLLGVSQHSATLRGLFGSVPSDAPTIGGFLYLTVASLAAGMTVSALRWAFLDTLHAKTGLKAPDLDFSRLGGNVEALTMLIDIHYRHYLYYGNMFVAVAIAYATYRMTNGFAWAPGVFDATVIVIEIVFFVTSRDTLRKYYARSRQLLPPRKA